MPPVVKILTLYFLNSVAFIIQDFRKENVSEQPTYVRHPTASSLAVAFLLTPILPFLLSMGNMVAGRLGTKHKVELCFRVFYTSAAYYVSYNAFSPGLIIGFILVLVSLRHVLDRRQG